MDCTYTFERENDPHTHQFTHTHTIDRKMTLAVIPVTLDVFVLYTVFLVFTSGMVAVLLNPNVEENKPYAEDLEYKYSTFSSSLREVHFYILRATVPASMSKSLSIHPMMSIMFVYCTLVGSLFFLPLLLASVVRQAKTNFTSELKTQRKRLISIGFLRAYLTMCQDKRGLSYLILHQFCVELKKKNLVTRNINFSEFRNLVRNIDKNGDGLIDASEFVQICDQMQIRRPIDKSLVYKMSREQAFGKFVMAMSTGVFETDESERLKSGYIQRLVARHLPTAFVLFLSNAFWEPAMGLEPAYQWYKLERGAPHIARELLKQLGWGISSGRERLFLTHRHRDYVAPELWSYLCSNYFVDLEQQPDESQARRMRRFDSVSRERVMRSMNFDKEPISPGFEVTNSCLSNRKSVRLKNLNIVKNSGQESNRDVMIRRFASVRMRHSESVQDYEKRLQVMRDKVVDSTGFPISDDLAVMTLFNGLRIEIASRVFEKQREEFPGIAHSSYEKRAKWLVSLKIDETYELGIGDRVLITKAGSSHLGSVAIVSALHAESFRITVKMRNGEEKWYHPSELVLDEHMRRMNNRVEKNLHEEMYRYRKLSTNPRIVAETAARVAIEAAVRILSIFFPQSI